MFRRRQRNANIRWLWLSILVVIVDQVSKYAASTKLVYGIAEAVFPGFNLLYISNRGAAFSLFDSASGWQQGFFVGLAVIVSIGICRYFTRLPRKAPLTASALALILGGALGNLCDRLVHGYVIDLIQLYLKTWSWPVFNLADTAICMGAMLLAIAILRDTKS